jgi:hypothetical protein
MNLLDVRTTNACLDRDMAGYANYESLAGNILTEINKYRDRDFDKDETYL